MNAPNSSGMLQVKHGTTEQWRILQRPLQEGEDEAAAPMKTRLRRHTEQSMRERETRSGETKSAPTSPLDVVSPTDLSSHSKPAQWTVDQVWSFISNLPGETRWIFRSVFRHLKSFFTLCRLLLDFWCSVLIPSVVLWFCPKC